MFREERVPGEMPMNDGTNCEQLMLFRKRLAWQELPRGIRDSTIDLVTTLCVEIAMELVIQEQDNESDEDYSLASRTNGVRVSAAKQPAAGQKERGEC